MASKAETTNIKASTHDTTMPLLNSVYDEFKELAKKSPRRRLVKIK